MKAQIAFIASATKCQWSERAASASMTARLLARSCSSCVCSEVKLSINFGSPEAFARNQFSVGHRLSPRRHRGHAPIRRAPPSLFRPGGCAILDHARTLAQPPPHAVQSINRAFLEHGWIMHSPGDVA